jgi:hypothetical protein
VVNPKVSEGVNYLAPGQSGFPESFMLKMYVLYSVVHPDPDPAGSEIISKLGSGSVINSGSGFESGSKLSSASN